MPVMESYLANNNPDTRATYQIAQETYQLVNEYAGDIVRKLGYPIVESPQESIRIITLNPFLLQPIQRL